MLFRSRDLMFGVFAGNIEEEAQVSGVTLSGATMRIGAITPGTGYSFNLVANGDRTGLTVTDSVKLEVYGTDLMNGTFNFTVRFVEDENGDPVRPEITVNENGDLGITFVTTVRTYTGSYVINYQEASND